MGNQSLLRIAVKNLYDAQTLRIQMDNRVKRAAKEGIHQDRLANRVAGMAKLEKDALADVKDFLLDRAIWKKFLNDIKGCGPALGGTLVAEVGDIGRFATVSKLWAYCGYHVVDGAAAKRKRGEKANWNQFLKTKLFLLGESFLKSKSQYSKIYYHYKTRMENRPCGKPKEDHAVFKKDKSGKVLKDKKGKPLKAETALPNGCTKGHVHQKSMRYMIKIFLMDYYLAACKIEGITPRPPYAEELLGKKHRGSRRKEKEAVL